MCIRDRINSVLSPGVYVRKGAVVKDSVLLNNVIVGENAKLDRVIADKNVITVSYTHLC